MRTTLSDIEMDATQLYGGAQDQVNKEETISTRSTKRSYIGGIIVCALGLGFGLISLWFNITASMHCANGASLYVGLSATIMFIVGSIEGYKGSCLWLLPGILLELVFVCILFTSETVVRY